MRPFTYELKLGKSRTSNGRKLDTTRAAGLVEKKLN